MVHAQQAHLERAWALLRKGCSGAAKVGHIWIRSAGVHEGKVLRAMFNKLVSHAQTMIGMHAAMAYWQTAAIHACIDTWREATEDAKRRLRLLRGALSHHSSVLLQAVVKEW